MNRFVISGSSIADFQRCPLRWCFRWVENRVPRRVSSALRTGTAIHTAFERGLVADCTIGAEYAKGSLVASALQEIITTAEQGILDADEMKSLVELRELVEPLKHWTDAYPIDETLEVETPFEFPVGDGIVFQGRPDRVVRMGSSIMHCQYKTAAATQNLGLFIDTARNSLHELIYGHYLEQKYTTYSGTLYTIIRKLQYRSKAKGKEGKPLHSPHEFFMQHLIGIDRAVQQRALDELPILGQRMRETAETFLEGGVVPQNRSMDRGYFGNSRDPYYPVIMGEASLDDDTLFMPREDLYAEEESEA